MSKKLSKTIKVYPHVFGQPGEQQVEFCLRGGWAMVDGQYKHQQANHEIRRRFIGRVRLENDGRRWRTKKYAYLPEGTEYMGARVEITAKAIIDAIKGGAVVMDADGAVLEGPWMLTIKGGSLIKLEVPEA